MSYYRIFILFISDYFILLLPCLFLSFPLFCFLILFSYFSSLFFSSLFRFLSSSLPSSHLITSSTVPYLFPFPLFFLPHSVLFNLFSSLPLLLSIYSAVVLADSRYNRQDKRSKFPPWITQFLGESALNLSVDVAVAQVREKRREI